MKWTKIVLGILLGLVTWGCSPFAFLFLLLQDSITPGSVTAISMIILGLVWLISPLGTGYLFYKSNKSVGWGLLAGFMLGPVGLLIGWFLLPAKPAETDTLKVKDGARVVGSHRVTLPDEDKQVRQTPTSAPRQIDDTQNVEQLTATLKQADPAARRTAIKSLEQIGDVQAVNSLLTVFREKNKAVRQSAIEALGNIGPPAVGPLIAALEDKNKTVGRCAAEALGHSGDIQAVAPLIMVLKDKDWLIRQSAARALGQIGDASAAEPLLAALKDTSKNVRQAAAGALAQIKPQLEDAGLRARVTECLEAVPQKEKPSAKASARQSPSKPPQPITTGATPNEPKQVIPLTPSEIALLKQHGNDFGRLYQTAATNLQNGRYDEAFQAFLILTKAAPQEITAWRACGIALYSKDELVWKKQGSGNLPYANAEMSLTYFDKALELDRNDHLSWYYRGFALAQIGHITNNKKRLKEGLDAFDEALRTRPGDQSTLQAKAQFEKAYLTLGGNLPRAASGGQFKNQARQRAQVWWKQQGRTSGVCDVCNGSVTSANSYLIDSKDVLRSEAYFDSYAKNPLIAMMGLDPEQAKAMQRMRVMSDQTPWMVCPNCIELFE